MKKKTVFTSKSLPHVKDKGKALRRVDADKVAKALGAERIPAAASTDSPVERSSARMANVAKKVSAPSHPKKTITIELDDEEIRLLDSCMMKLAALLGRDVSIEEATHFILLEGGKVGESREWFSGGEIVAEARRLEKKRA
jgi:hypothetical protein